LDNPRHVGPACQWPSRHAPHPDWLPGAALPPCRAIKAPCPSRRRMRPVPASAAPVSGAAPRCPTGPCPKPAPPPRGRPPARRLHRASRSAPTGRPPVSDRPTAPRAASTAPPEARRPADRPCPTGRPPRAPPPARRFPRAASTAPPPCPNPRRRRALRLLRGRAGGAPRHRAPPRARGGRVPPPSRPRTRGWRRWRRAHRRAPRAASKRCHRGCAARSAGRWKLVAAAALRAR
jgi:hypothetical protein